MYQVEKKIPIPVKRGGNEPKYPLRTMNVGESVFIGDSPYKAVAQAVQYCQRKTKRRFTVRSVDGGVRVWRTK